jgi:hypothetical protein
MDKGDAMISAGLDQDYAAWVEKYDSMTPEERGELAEDIVRLEGSSALCYRLVGSLAGVAFMEIAARWAAKTKEG